MHARITEQNGSLYIEDAGSANHTYVNGTMLRQGVPAPLGNGDTFMLAKEEFVVTIERA